MAENRGTIYERQLCDKMKAAEVVSESFQPAASDSTAPDIVFQTSKNANEKLEVKLDLKTDFGQGSFNFVNGQWVLGGARTTAADEMRRILTNADATGIATREWGTETPWRDMPGVGGKNGTLTVEQAREDYDNHPDKFISVPTSVVFDYFADKDCLLYTSPSPRDRTRSRMPSSA